MEDSEFGRGKWFLLWAKFLVFEVKRSQLCPRTTYRAKLAIVLKYIGWVVGTTNETYYSRSIDVCLGIACAEY